MDTQLAESIFKAVCKSGVNGINIIRYINHGKSAAVYEGMKGTTPVAVKIFDNQLLQKYGTELQQKRFDLELSLKNHKIEHMVQIVECGSVEINTVTHRYITMQLVNGKNLKEYVVNNVVDFAFISKAVTTLIDVTEKLLCIDPPIAHRDIKPENVMVSDDGEIILMDLGVIKLIGNTSMTDLESKQFMGTIRYSPPEFLTRNESDTINGWRAINLYQIGTVMHDLIMEKELFSEVTPLANLVIKIKEDMPSIQNNKYSYELLQLTRDLLSKKWQNRLTLCPLERIKRVLSDTSGTMDMVSSIFDDIKAASMPIREELEAIDKINRGIEEKRIIKENTSTVLLKRIDDSFLSICNEVFVERITHSVPFKLPDNEREFKSVYIFYKLECKFDYGFTRPIYVLFRVLNDESSYVKIFVKIIVARTLPDNFKEPRKLFDAIFEPQGRKLTLPSGLQRVAPPPQPININFMTVFEGIFDSDDGCLIQQIRSMMGLILKRASILMKPEVDAELEDRKKRLEGKQPSIVIRTSVGSNITFIESLE